MNTLVFFIRSAFRNLRRGGQRIVVALLCVAFGVMSLTAMILLAKSIEKMLLLQPVELIGADLTLDRATEDSISPAEGAELSQLQQAGQIKQFSLIAYSKSLTFHMPDSGELIFPSTGMGIDPAVYPLAGNLSLDENDKSGLSKLLANTGDVIITRDMALEYKLKAGDSVVLSDLGYGKPVVGKIRAIAKDTPNHQGSKIYYNQQTARELSGMDRPGNTVVVNAVDPSSLKKTLVSTGWRVFTADELAVMDLAQQKMIEMGLDYTGILGLLVGGIGIANTMQVLLRRRRREVAIWKTIGYTGAQLQQMFALEAAILGLAGSLLGAGLGVLLSRGMVDLLSRTTTILIRWVFSPDQIIFGILVGMFMTIIFALWAIISTSRVRPLAIMRNEMIQKSQLPLFQGIGLGLLLLVPFTALTSLIMGSVLKGIGVLVVSIIGLLILGGGLSALSWLVTRLLPFHNWPLGRISIKNLRKRGPALVFAMIALFVGVTSLSFGAVISNSGQSMLKFMLAGNDRENIAIYGPQDAASAIQQMVQSTNPVSYSVGHQTPVQRIESGQDMTENISPILIGRPINSEYVVKGAPWGSQSNGVYVDQSSGIPQGSDLTVTLLDGSTHTFTVVGSYLLNDEDRWPGTAIGVLLPDEVLMKMSKPANVEYFLKIPDKLVRQVSASLGKALPQTTIINLPDYLSHLTRSYQNLIVFIFALSGLCLLAGILLVANAVSLAMLDRRYEIGVFKAVGFSRKQVLISLVVEYVLIAVIATLAGLGIVSGFFWVLGLTDKLVGGLFRMTPLLAGEIAGFSIGITLLTVLAVTWRPASVSPSIILNDR
jgi:putative ABC transport system permease protein